jgi:hypothetical protein
MAMTIVESTRPVTGGVDTHADIHVVAAVDANGGVLGVESFATTPAGYAQLHGWLAGFGEIVRVGVEGTGAYGAGLARHLRGQGRRDRSGPGRVIGASVRDLRRPQTVMSKRSGCCWSLDVPAVTCGSSI